MATAMLRAADLAGLSIDQLEAILYRIEMGGRYRDERDLLRADVQAAHAAAIEGLSTSDLLDRFIRGTAHDAASEQFTGWSISRVPFAKEIDVRIPKRRP